MIARRFALAHLLRFARPLVAGLALASTAFGVAAQTLDELTVGTQGTSFVARITFNSNVRLVRQTPLTATQLLRLDFEVVGADDRIRSQTVEESRSAPGAGGAPDLRLSYVPVPGARIKQLTLILSRAAVVRARQGSNARTLELVLTDVAATPASIAPVTDRRYAVTLQTVPLSAPERMLPVPMQFQALDAFSVAVVVDGVPSVQVNLGYFETEAQAQRVRTMALARFPDASVIDLFERRQEVLKSASVAAQAAAPQVTAAPLPAPALPIVVPAGATPPASPPAVVVQQAAPAVTAPAVTAPTPVAPAATPPAGPLTEVDRRAAELLEKGRRALLAKDYEAAIDLFNQLLLLPPNSASKDAQELIGLAWERAGNVARARIEYELYMRLFPQGEGTDRVAQRLASLEVESVRPPPVAAAPIGAATATASAEKPKMFTGSIAQYYYGGVARSQSLVTVTAGVDQQTLTRTTQSALVTSVDLNGRFIQPDAETRLVVRGTGASNLSSESRNNSLLNSAYVDYRRTASGLGIRAGRQSAISGGLIGLFDGVSIVYPVRSGLKIDVMGGVPASVLVSAPKQRLFAAVVEVDGIADGLGGNLYILDQTVDGYTNRRALGTEVRYSSDNYSIYSLVDYDIYFKSWNAATLQGSVQAPGQTTVTLFVDLRKAPSLQLTNALITTGQSSLQDYLAGRSLAEAQAAALGITAKARQGMISVSRPLSERWQMGVDLRYTQIGALPAVGNFEATPATGAQVGVSGQLNGSNLYSSRDLSNFGLYVLHAPQFNGAQFSYNNLTGLRDNDLTVEPSIRYYSQKSNDGLKLSRITPGMRLTYRLSRRASLIGESIVEFSSTDGPSGNDTTRSVFFNVGYRYEFN